MKPTIGRSVAYWPTQLDRSSGMHFGSERYFAAIVVAVLPNGNYNLAVFDHWGNSHPRQDVGFVQYMETLSGYCTWPPGSPMAEEAAKAS